MSTEDRPKVCVDRAYLFELLRAVNGPGHLIRELQATINFPGNAIIELTNEFNAIIAAENKAQAELMDVPSTPASPD